MLLASHLVFVGAALISVRAPAPQSCPSGAQVAVALSARMPGSVLTQGTDAKGVEVFPLSVETEGGSTEVRLSNGEGEVQLIRTLRTDSQEPSDCVALADTVALVIERFFDDTGWERPGVVEAAAPAPLPAPAVELKDVATPPADEPATETPERWQLDLRTEGRTGRDGLGSLGLAVGLRAYLDAHRSLFAALSIGGQGPQSLEWIGPSQMPGQGMLFALEADLAGGVRTGLAGGFVEGGVLTRLQVLIADENAPTGPGRTATGVGQAAGLFAGYRYPLGRRFFVGGHATVQLGLTRHKVVVADVGTVTETPRVFATLAALVGVAF